MPRTNSKVVYNLPIGRCMLEALVENIYSGFVTSKKKSMKILQNNESFSPNFTYFKKIEVYNDRATCFKFSVFAGFNTEHD
jgi:hypothetical protein